MKNNKDKNLCPNCGMPLQRNYCLHCGYMTNGIFIGKNKPESISDVEMYLGKRYDKINRNENSFIAFFLGPFYFAYNKFVLFCFLCMIFDFLFCKLAVLIFYKHTALTRFLAFFILRIGYSACANMLYLWLCSIKVKIIKNIYKEKYIDYLRRHDENTSSILMLILAIAILVVIFILIFEAMSNGII